MQAKAWITSSWLIGRGWDQNDWPVKEFPSKEKLDERFPNRPVFLTRIDGHAAIANQKALDIAGIKPGDKIDGGQIEVRYSQSIESFTPKLTGILVDNAVGLVKSKIPPARHRSNKSILAGRTAQLFCGWPHNSR